MMKQFLKSVFAVVCGTLVTIVLLFVLGFAFFGALLSASSATPALPKQGVLCLDLSKTVIAEQTMETDPMSLLQGTDASTVGVLDAVRAIEMAETDPAVQYIYLKVDNNISELSALEELRRSLALFRSRSGKSVIAYTESPTTGGYYLASVSDKVFMTPHIGATTMLSGVSSQMVFLGDLLSRLGVNVQLIRHGKYKSAGEMYTRSSSSAENREQYQRMVDSMWETLSASISESRQMSVASLNDAIDGLKLVSPRDFVDCGLVDALLTRGELESKLAVYAGKDDIKDVRYISFSDYVAAKRIVSSSREKIAVIYANGEIMDGRADNVVAGDRFASIISRVRADSTVKAVVLRVNSPGGSVLASEKIKCELDSLKAVKPLVASYGSYAASGGYWISTACDKIYSDATTLTGSIGVFGLVPDFSALAHDKLHVNVESVNSNAHGDMYGMMRPFDRSEYAYMQSSIESVYERFTSIVSEARSLPVETVDAVGQGRVWTGADALKIHLVDEIGTLGDALSYAASLAGDADLSNWHVQELPAPKSSLDQLLSRLQGSGDESALVKAAKDLGEPEILARMDMLLSVR